jgi:serine protease Do
LAGKTSLENNGYTFKKLVAVVATVAIISSLLTAALVGGLFLLGSEIDSNSREEQRQTVVQEGEVIADVAAEVGPSVVSITTSQTSIELNSLLQPQRRVSQGAGTGIIIEKDGLILTNKHVIPVSIDGVKITLSDGTVYEDVDVVGRDPLNDLALLKIKNPKNLTPAKLGNSSSVRTGEKVIAIGNALGQFQNTVTSGIISGIGRPIEASDGSGDSEQLTNLLQTDAAINPGNSGGPLVNFNGEVIGVNTAIAEGAEGVGFSIPINEAKAIINSAQRTGEISRPYLGVRYVMLTPEFAEELELDVKDGAYIDTEKGSVVKNGPADKAGVKSGDVILKVNDIVLNQTTPLVSAVGRFNTGDEVELTILRGSEEVFIKATLAKAPIE